MASPEYRITRKSRIVIGEGLPTAFSQVIVTYEAPGLPPFSLFLAEKDLTTEKIQEEILKSIDTRKAERL